MWKNLCSPGSGCREMPRTDFPPLGVPYYRCQPCRDGRVLDVGISEPLLYLDDICSASQRVLEAIPRELRRWAFKPHASASQLEHCPIFIVASIFFDNRAHLTVSLIFT